MLVLFKNVFSPHISAGTGQHARSGSLPMRGTRSVVRDHRTLSLPPSEANFCTQSAVGLGNTPRLIRLPFAPSGIVATVPRLAPQRHSVRHTAGPHRYRRVLCRWLCAARFLTVTFILFLFLFLFRLLSADAKIRAVKYFCKTLHKRAMISNLGGRLTNHLNGLHLTPEKRQRWSSQLQQQQQQQHVRSPPPHLDSCL